MAKKVKKIKKAEKRSSLVEQKKKEINSILDTALMKYGETGFVEIVDSIIRHVRGNLTNYAL